MSERRYYGVRTGARVHLYRNCAGMSSAIMAGWNVVEYDSEAATRMGVCRRCKARADREATNGR